ncbi:melanoma-associated antigen B5-like [Perognathus longimembris pacificus]|uniref:melanoma-associated antigen B5-like n=1 Tax=Perognathus longimembris pacificus TaxID=214514 RepID=UPI00201861A2|nr:melanoma-associated antigen B5-like [Perognathus longimembris pacificus]
MLRCGKHCKAAKISLSRLALTSPMCNPQVVLYNVLKIPSTLELIRIVKEPCTIGLPTTTEKNAVNTRLNEGEISEKEEKKTSEIKDSTEISCIDIVAKKAIALTGFLLYRYAQKKPIFKKDMLTIISCSDEYRFTEILMKANENIESAFAVIIKETDTTRHKYALVSKLKLPNNGRIHPGTGLPKTGLVMTILGVIFLMGDSISEENLWKFLKTKAIYPGKTHYIYGEPELITKDLVRLNYLKYKQVPNSNPPQYEFLWGPRALKEATKKEALDFLGNNNVIVPKKFTATYGEDRRDDVSIGTATTSGTNNMVISLPLPGAAASPPFY